MAAPGVTVLVATALAAGAVATGVQPSDERMLLDALSLARSRQSGALDRFHATYILEPADPRIARLEVITEFRRAVMLAQMEASRGNFILSPTGLGKLLAPYAGRTAIRAEVRVSPLATFVGPPEYHIELAAGGRTLTVIEETREPVYPPGAPVGSGLVAVVVETSFFTDAVRQPACCELSVTEPDGTPLLRQDLGGQILFLARLSSPHDTNAQETRSDPSIHNSEFLRSGSRNSTWSARTASSTADRGTSQVIRNEDVEMPRGTAPRARRQADPRRTLR